MWSTRWFVRAALAPALVLVLAGLSPDVAGARPGVPVERSREVVDLGTLPGALSSQGNAINDRGWAVGVSFFDDGTGHAFIWRDGRMTDLGTLTGPSGSSRANAINDRGDVVGGSLAPGGGFHATLWRGGEATDLGTLGGTFSEATGVNDRGDVVGFSALAGDEAFHAFLWRRGTMTDLGPLDGQTASTAHAINNRGEIVGASGGPVIWRRGGLAPLPLSPGAESGDALDNADNGNVAGYMVMPGGVTINRAVVWRGGRPIDLGWEEGTSQAFGVNSRGQAVGWRVFADQTFGAFVWERGTMTGLPSLTGERHATARGINERGEIVGDSPIPGGDPSGPIPVHAVVWR